MATLTSYMNILVFDTETTGLVDFNLPLDAPTQPRLLQIAAVLTNTDDWRPRAVFSVLVKHDDPVICHPKALQAHGLIQELCHAYGVKLSYALHVFTTLLARAETFYAYNSDYDCAVLGGEFLRLKRNDDYALLKSHVKCVMKPLTEVCCIKSHAGGNKWPKLDEAYEFFMHQPRPAGAHDALMDVDATIKVLKCWLEFNEQKA